MFVIQLIKNKRPNQAVQNSEINILPRVSPLTVITTRNDEIKSIFGANVHLVPGLCLLHVGIGGAPCISHKIMARKPYFHILDYFSETTSRLHFLFCQKIPQTQVIII